ncbi:preconditioning-inducible protein [Kwoniella heveanensis BCC8398]|uniref:Autophagy-related protein 3 n=1 Tax=Kwoniella heveanensis BCC8398 TaxID=1296120 RepID=A0A1B9GJQ1_9TREE|nr:preconditioning-inducible protein [Kwoniella heveanensis BCC8398]
MNNPLLAIQSQYWAVRDYLSPVLRESKFKEHGRITPEEFVVAGDFLTFKFPVWQWEKGDPSKARDFLPADKQYLITRGVPCLRRATDIYSDADEDAEKLLNFMDEKGDDDEWVATHFGRASQAKPADMDEIPDISDSPNLSSSAPSSAMKGLSIGEDEHPLEVDEIPDIDDIPDMDEAAGLEDEDDDAAVRIVHPSEADVKSTATKNLLQVRTYDVLISYDRHYQVPRIWLFGYDENKRPLTPAQVFQDVPNEHAFKTMTMEIFPHTGQQLASVHPCKHASVMKKFVDRMDAAQAAQAAQMGEEDSSAASVEVGGKNPGSGSKKKWGIGGMVRKVTGGSSSASSLNKEEKKDMDADAPPTGVQVDMYIVIVSVQ